MKVMEYKEKDSKEQRRAADIESLLEDMEMMERFNGSYSAEKIAEIYFKIKADLLNALNAEQEKKQ